MNPRIRPLSTGLTALLLIASALPMVSAQAQQWNWHRAHPDAWYASHHYHHRQHWDSHHRHFTWYWTL